MRRTKKIANRLCRQQRVDPINVTSRSLHWNQNAKVPTGTEQSKRRLRTGLCRTPAQVSNSWLVWILRMCAPESTTNQYCLQVHDNATRTCSPFQTRRSQSVSQSGLDALRPALHFTYVACSLAAKIKNVLKCCFQTSQFCAATSQWAKPW